MPKQKPTENELAIKVQDLPPKKDPQGGSIGFSNNTPLSIPPPGFVLSQSYGPDKRP
jgi:hypothetical protein